MDVIRRIPGIGRPINNAEENAVQRVASARQAIADAATMNPAALKGAVEELLAAIVEADNLAAFDATASAKVQLARLVSAAALRGDLL
jgi:hypothetical protein